jgi:hypothetical protein
VSRSCTLGVLLVDFWRKFNVLTYWAGAWSLRERHQHLHHRQATLETLKLSYPPQTPAPRAHCFTTITIAAAARHSPPQNAPKNTAAFRRPHRSPHAPRPAKTSDRGQINASREGRRVDWLCMVAAGGARA